jgi:hypothetical protein
MRRFVRNVVRSAIGRVKRAPSPASGESTSKVPLFGRTYIPPAGEYASRLEQLLDRGVSITIIYTGGYPKYYNYPTQYRESFRGYDIVDRISFIYMPKSDHLATPRAAQRDLLDIVVKWAEAAGSRSQVVLMPATRP